MHQLGRAPELGAVSGVRTGAEHEHEHLSGRGGAFAHLEVRGGIEAAQRAVRGAHERSQRRGLVPLARRAGSIERGEGALYLGQVDQNAGGRLHACRLDRRGE